MTPGSQVTVWNSSWQQLVPSPASKVTATLRMRLIVIVILSQLWLAVQGQGANILTKDSFEETHKTGVESLNDTVNTTYGVLYQQIKFNGNMTLKVLIKIEELLIEQDILKNRQALGAFVAGLQLAIVLIYLLVVSIKKLVECVNKKREKTLQENLLEMESRLEERKRKNRADRKKMSPSAE